MALPHPAQGTAGAASAALLPGASSSPFPAPRPTLGPRPPTSWGRGGGRSPQQRLGAREGGRGWGGIPAAGEAGEAAARVAPAGRAGSRKVAVPAPRRRQGGRGDGTPGRGRVMWPLTVPPPLLLLLLCSGLAGQVGAWRAGAGARGSRRDEGLNGSRQKGGLGLHKPPPGLGGAGVAAGEGLDVHPGFGGKEEGPHIQPQAAMAWGTV